MRAILTPEERIARSATARTAHRWRKRLAIKQLKIEDLEESVRSLREQIAARDVRIQSLKSHVSREAREAMRESTFDGTPARDYYR